MSCVKDVFDCLCRIAPLHLQMDFDNAGFLVGRGEAEVKKVLLALDITDTVVNEAVSEGASLIVSHHPVIFHAIKSIRDDHAGDKLLRLSENRIAAICMHTNLDIAPGGVNDVLIELLGAESETALDESLCGRVGNMRQEMSLESFLAHCKRALNANGLRYYSAGKPVRRLAVMGGAGSGSIEDAFNKGCDTYVTADIKYHEFQLAEELGINLIDADHFSTENPVMYMLRDKLKAELPELDVSISKLHRPVIEFF